MRKNGGWGVVYQKIMRDPDISVESKAIYAYLACLAGDKNICYPSIDTMQRELNMGKNRLAKHMGQLIAVGVVEKVREKNGNIFGHNTYKIAHELEVIDDLNHIFESCAFRAVGNRAVEGRAVENEATNNNMSLINNIGNKNSVNYYQVVDLYNSVCTSFPKLTKLSDRRKQAIRARFNQGYTLDDFKKLFELAEGSSFLKGGNNRNWQATFDWLIADANMAKVLDGNYTDKGAKNDDKTNSKVGRTARDFYEQILGTGDRY